VLDPALLRSGRLDRKIEFPLPNEEARAQIMRIHSRKMKVDKGVNWQELARSTDEFGGAQLKAVCVEAGMIALRLGQAQISHEHYVDAIAEVQAKKKDTGEWRAGDLFRFANDLCSEFLRMMRSVVR
jgi:26S proteasome regulatory subunit T5